MKNWIQRAVGGKHRGALHRALGVNPNSKIPAAKMSAAAQSNNPRIKRMVTLARTLKSLHK